MQGVRVKGCRDEMNVAICRIKGKKIKKKKWGMPGATRSWQGDYFFFFLCAVVVSYSTKTECTKQHVSLLNWVSIPKDFENPWNKEVQHVTPLTAKTSHSKTRLRARNDSKKKITHVPQHRRESAKRLKKKLHTKKGGEKTLATLCRQTFFFRP